MLRGPFVAMTTIFKSFRRCLVLFNMHNDLIDMRPPFCRISCKSNNRKDTFEGSPRTFGTNLVFLLDLYDLMDNVKTGHPDSEKAQVIENITLK